MSRKHVEVDNGVEIEPLMGVKEASEILDLTPVTVRKLAAKRQIPAVLVGCQWKFQKRKLEEWIEAGGNIDDYWPEGEVPFDKFLERMLLDLLFERKEWVGTLNELYNILYNNMTEELQAVAPETLRQFSIRLRQLVPVFRKKGLEVAIEVGTNRNRLVRIVDHSANNGKE